VKKVLAMIWAYVSLIMIALGVSMLDSRFWVLGCVLLILSGGYLALYAKVRGFMKVENE
jgi:hypothetical protein